MFGNALTTVEKETLEGPIYHAKHTQLSLWDSFCAVGKGSKTLFYNPLEDFASGKHL